MNFTDTFRWATGHLRYFVLLTCDKLAGMTTLGERQRRGNNLIWWGIGLWACAILLYLTIANPAAALTIRLIGLIGVGLLVAGIIKHWRRERPAGD